jgi:hypothetical protein
MSGDLNVIGGRRETTAEDLTPAQREQVFVSKARAQARAEFQQLNLTAVGRGVHADEVGNLYEEVGGTNFSASGLLIDRRDADGFFLEDELSGLPIFVKRTTSGPATLKELEEERTKQREARRRGELERVKALEERERSAVTMAELMDIPYDSLRAAAYRIVGIGGKVYVKRSGELVIELPVLSRPRSEAMPAARLLFACSSTVIETLKSSKHGIDSLPNWVPRCGEVS